MANALAELLCTLCGDYKISKMDPELILSEMEIGAIMRPTNIVCADIQCRDIHLHLHTGYSRRELDDFLISLGTINYDSGFGLQELYGVVALTNNEWLGRG